MLYSAWYMELWPRAAELLKWGGNSGWATADQAKVIVLHHLFLFLFIFSSLHLLLTSLIVCKYAIECLFANDIQYVDFLLSR